MLKAPPNWLAGGAAFLALLSLPITIRAEQPAEVEAEYRGCESAGWCRFWIESLDPLAASLHRVRPEGVAQVPGDETISVVVRDRLNALLANMIHQAKHVVLHDLRKLDDGTFMATITVNGVNLASDPVLLDLRAKVTGTTR